MHKRLWFSCSVLLLGCSGERNQNSTVDRSHENVGQNPVSDETKELSESAAVTEQLLSEPAVKIALAEAERRSANLVSAPSFRFLRSSLTCQDNAGRKGLNPGPDVGECTDLRNRDFTGVDLSAKNLRGANFTQSVLRTAKFGSSDLRGADLWKSNWESALFRGALFNEATKLPFEKSVALSQGMVEVSYKSLDTQLDAALIAWNKSTDPDLPKAIIDLIALDASPAAVSGNFLTALVAKRSEHLFDLALYNGVDFSNIDQKPLILRLVDAGDVELLKILVGKGLSLSHNNPNIEQALGYAISGRKTPVLKALLTLGADPNARSTAGSSGISPLSRIASGGYTEVIRDMVAAGADVHEINQGLSLVQNAASLEIAKLLVELGADPTRVNLFKKPSDQLMWIASQGANVKIIDESGRNLLSYAIEQKSPAELLNFLFTQGLDTANVSKDGRSLYYYAYAAGNKGIVDRLMSLGVIPKGMGPGAGSSAKKTMLQYMVEKDRSRVLPVLALPGAGGSLSMDQGVWDFLMTASADEIKFAAAAGVSMQRQHSDNTPLIHSLLEYACRDSNWEYNRDGWLSRINAILDSGAPLESINQGGRTPLLTLKDCYEKKPQRELIKLLLERGAKADALDNYQRGIFYDYQPYTADDIPMLDQLFAKGADPRRISSYSLKGTLSCHTNSQGQRVPDEAGVTIVRYIIAKGAPLNLLAHEIMSRDDIACISALQKIFSNTFIATLNFTQNSSSTNYLPSRTYLEAVTNHVVEPQQNRLTDGAILAFLQKPEAKAYYMNVLTMTKSLVTQGMLAKNETVNDWNYSTILAAYNLLHFDLIRYLTDIGFRHPQFKMSHLYYRILGPDNACHWMSGNTYLPTQGGCMAPNNVVWSVPSTADHCTAPTSDHLGHCDSVGATGKVPLKDAHPGYCESKSDPEAGQYRGQTVRLWTTPTYKLLTAEIIAGGFAKFPLDTWVLFATDGDARGAVNIKTGQLKIINNLMDNSPAQVTHLCVLGNYGLNQ